MPDITKHPLLRKVYELAREIERAGTSPEWTSASIAASDLSAAIEKAVDRDAA